MARLGDRAKSFYLQQAVAREYPILASSETEIQTLYIIWRNGGRFPKQLVRDSLGGKRMLAKGAGDSFPLTNLGDPVDFLKTLWVGTVYSRNSRFWRTRYP